MSIPCRLLLDVTVTWDSPFDFTELLGCSKNEAKHGSVQWGRPVLAPNSLHPAAATVAANGSIVSGGMFVHSAAITTTGVKDVKDLI